MDDPDQDILLPDLAATEALAARIAAGLSGPAVLALYGDLGVGKTTFARALLRALGVTGDVPSPTFTLVQSYDTTRGAAHHFDLYRIKNPEELEDIGFLDASGLVLVEWPEKAGRWLPARHTALTFSILPDGSRHVALRHHPRLDVADWSLAEGTPIKADFSTRSFTRLTRAHSDPSTAIRMQAGPNDKTDQFVALSAVLRRLGLAAPAMYHAAPDKGLVVMEDFGDRTLGRMLDDGAEPLPLYSAAARVLKQLHASFTPAMAAGINLPHYNAALFAEQVGLFLDVVPGITRGHTPGEAERTEFRDLWLRLLVPLDALPRTLLLRDFMPDNLMHLDPPRRGQSIGIIDFQDAGLGPAAYDLASLVEVVRRDHGRAMMQAVLDAYGPEGPAMRTVCRLLSAQRHMRVLAIVYRQNRLAFIPRIWDYLRSLLREEPALDALRPWLDRTQPDP